MKVNACGCETGKGEKDRSFSSEHSAVEGLKRQLLRLASRFTIGMDVEKGIRRCICRSALARKYTTLSRTRLEIGCFQSRQRSCDKGAERSALWRHHIAEGAICDRVQDCVRLREIPKRSGRHSSCDYSFADSHLVGYREQTFRRSEN